MKAVMMNTCQIVICLFAVSNGQTPSMSVIEGYVNKSGIAYIVCSIGTYITGSVAIARNGALAFDCPVSNVCVNQGLSIDYIATQDVNAGTTTLIIRNADKNRDGVNWTCSYNSGVPSVPVILNVVSPATSSRLIEDADKITVELTCAYPNILSFEFYLGGVIYSETTPNMTGFQACTLNYEASVNHTLTFPKKHLQSYNGIFNVYINNGFYTNMLGGTRTYTFTVHVNSKQYYYPVSHQACKRKLPDAPSCMLYEATNEGNSYALGCIP